MKTFYLSFAFLALYQSVYSHETGDEALSTKDTEIDQLNVGKDLKAHHDVYFLETFNDFNDFNKSWIIATATKEIADGPTTLFDGDWVTEKAAKDPLPNDIGLTFKMKAKYRAISAKLSKHFTFASHPLVIQYEVLFQEGQECGGAYLKLISKERPVSNLNKFNDKTPYTIMFGPDKCGTNAKLHFIFRHFNPVLNIYEEKHCKPPKSRIDEVFTDAKPHLFTLKIDPNNTYSISIDHKVVNEGSLLEDFDPPVNPPREIDDPHDKKPSDWDDREKIPDPTAKKPEDWNEEAPPEIPDVNAVKPSGWLEDEPINISDPSAERPDDWDDEMDGEWEAPLVPNPACEGAPGCGLWTPPLINNPDYKGKWSPPLIDNPNFAGIWKPRKILNPNYFEDNNPFLVMSSVDSLGFELWSMSMNIMFDNIILTSDYNIAKQFAAITFDKKVINMEKSADTLLNQFVAFTNRYPWLWALYIIVLLIPITLIVVCCFWNNKDSDAEHKKDDDMPNDSLSNSFIDESAVTLSPDERESVGKKARSTPLPEEDSSASLTQSEVNGRFADNGNNKFHLKEDSKSSVNKEADNTEDSEVAENVFGSTNVTDLNAPEPEHELPSTDENAEELTDKETVLKKRK